MKPDLKLVSDMPLSPDYFLRELIKSRDAATAVIATIDRQIAPLARQWADQRGIRPMPRLETLRQDLKL